MILKQILSTCSMGNVWRLVSRICMWILRFKGLIQSNPVNMDTEGAIESVRIKSVMLLMSQMSKNTFY